MSVFQPDPEFIRRKWFFMRWICRHEYIERSGVYGFFGLTRCKKCGKDDQLPMEKMAVTEFRATVSWTEPK